MFDLVRSLLGNTTYPAQCGHNWATRWCSNLQIEWTHFGAALTPLQGHYWKHTANTQGGAERWPEWHAACIEEGSGLGLSINNGKTVR